MGHCRQMLLEMALFILYMTYGPPSATRLRGIVISCFLLCFSDVVTFQSPSVRIDLCTFRAI